MDLSGLVGMFVGVHLLMAEQFHCPELVIAESEGKAFMGAAQKVLRHYSIEATQKTLDWIAFAGVTGGIYLTRSVAIANRRRAEAGRRPSRGPKVVPLRPGAAEPPPVIIPDAGDDPDLAS